MENNKPFEFDYSAKEQEEIRQIREKYLPKEQRETKMEQLRRLDAGVMKKANLYSISLGILSSLVMGVGMCCCLVWTAYFVLGIVVGVIGMAGIAMAYPLYVRILQKERARIAPQILKLTEELMQ